MATSFSANQYENAFLPKKLNNWEVPKVHRENPRRQDGFTQIIGNERGHILPGIPRSAKNPWGDYVGTWDLPQRIPGNCAKVQTARTACGQDRLMRQYDDANQVLSGTLKNQTRMSKQTFPALQPLTLAPGSGRGSGSGRRSGAAAPGSKMLQDGSPAVKPCSPMAKLSSPKAVSPKPPSAVRVSSQSPIPGIMDVPFDGKRSASPPIKSPGVPQMADGLIAF